MVTFLWRAAGCPEPTTSVHSFADIDEYAYYFKALLWAVDKGITAGTSGPTFSPDDGCTRAQMATFLFRFADKPDVEGDIKFDDVDTDSYYAQAVIWAAENGITAGTSDTTFSPISDCTRGQMATFLYRYFVEE